MIHLGPVTIVLFVRTPMQSLHAANCIAVINFSTESSRGLYWVATSLERKQVNRIRLRIETGIVVLKLPRK